MATTGKTARELELLIMDDLRQNPDCAALMGVVVSADGDDGGWSVSATVRSDASLPPNCERAKIAAAVRLRRDHHLVSED